MNSSPTFCLLSCVFLLCHYGFTFKWDEKQLKSYSYKEPTELTVIGKDLQQCQDKKNVCVMDSRDCNSMAMPSYGHDKFIKTSCRYLVHEKSFACKWIYLKDGKGKTNNSFIFSQSIAFNHCPSIFSPLAGFNLTIKAKDVINKMDMFSETYAIFIDTITQAPTPRITSVNASETSLNVTWTTGQWHIENCQIRYKLSSTEQWTVISVVIPETKDSEIVYVIGGLQSFNQYTIAVACNGSYGLWSDWSAESQEMTLEGVPTTPPYVSYCFASLDCNTLFLLWRTLQIDEARGVILGYEVTYSPTNPSLTNQKRIIHTSDLKAILMVAAEDYDITVTAYNSAGQSPSHHIRINAGLYQRLPAVRGLWACAEVNSFRVQWEKTAVTVTEFAIEWFSSGHPQSKQWKRINGSIFSTLLTGNIKYLERYNISVYPLYGTLCGPPESILASLECGTLLDIVQLQIVNVTKTSVTIQWEWQKKAPNKNVLRYRLALVGLNETRSLLVYPHQMCHSFYKLQPNAKYSVYINGETMSANFSKTNIEFSTPLFDNNEIITVAVSIAILIMGFGILSVLSRIYKDSFFPNIANPGHSVIGRWLLNSLYERDTIVRVLRLEDFSLTDHLTEKCLIQIEHQISSHKENFNEDMILTKMCLPDTCPAEIPDSMENPQTAPSLTEYVDLPLLSANFGYVENCQDTFQ